MRPPQTEYFAYFDRYVSLVTEEDVLALMQSQAGSVQAALGGLSDDRAGYRYEAGKWSVREALGHLLDTERVFGYRALSIARGETFSMPGFEQDDYVAIAGHDRVPIAELAAEFAALRRSYVLFFRHLDDAAWRRIGTANTHPTSTRALAYMMAGHVRHHARVFTERYGIPVLA